MKKVLLTIPEVARYLRVDIEDINYEVDQGHLPVVDIGSKVRVTQDALQTFLTTRKIPYHRTTSRPFVWLGLSMVLLTGVAIAISPFPNWQAQTIEPQAVTFKDESVTAVEDPERYALVNAPLDYRRFNDAENPDGRGFTHTLMSLQHQNHVEPDSLSFPWTLFINLDTDHDRGDGVASIVNLHHRGSGWAAGYHVDGFAWADGTVLGNNVEMSDYAGEGAYTVGVNIQNKAFRGDIGMQVQVGPIPDTHRFWQPGMDGSWQTGIKLSGTPEFAEFHTGIELGPNTNGRRGIWLRGDYQAGIDMGDNDLFLNAGAVIQLAGSQAVGLKFNPDQQRLEFISNNQVIAFLPVESRNVDLSR